MSRAQKRILAVGLLIMALTALFPPCFHIGPQSGTYRDFLYSGTFDGPKSLNIEKLIVEWMFIAAITGFLLTTVKGIAKTWAGWMDDFSEALEDQKEDTGKHEREKKQ